MLFLLSAVFYKGLFVYPNNTKIASGILSNHSLPQNNTKIPHTYIITSMITINFRQKATSEVAKTDSQISLVFQGIICQQIQRFLQCPARDLFRIHPTEEKYTPGSVSGSPLLPPAPSIKHFRCNVWQLLDKKERELNQCPLWSSKHIRFAWLRIFIDFISKARLKMSLCPQDKASQKRQWIVFWQKLSRGHSVIVF